MVYFFYNESVSIPISNRLNGDVVFSTDILLALAELESVDNDFEEGNHDNCTPTSLAITVGASYSFKVELSEHRKELDLKFEPSCS